MQAQRDLATAQNNELQAILAYRRSLVELERLQQTSLTDLEHHDSGPVTACATARAAELMKRAIIVVVILAAAGGGVWYFKRGGDDANAASNTPAGNQGRGGRQGGGPRWRRVRWTRRTGRLPEAADRVSR